MTYFRRIMTHYITLALRRAGVDIDSDTYAELDGAFEEIEEAFDRLEKRIKALEEEEAEESRGEISTAEAVRIAADAKRYMQ